MAFTGERCGERIAAIARHWKCEGDHKTPRNAEVATA
jgi:hypothetical protein